MTQEIRRAEQEVLTRLQSSMEHVSDDQLRRIVAMVDGLEDRGGFDVLLAPVRPRLATLHPMRTPNLRRLLFTPLDPLIVPRSSWQRGELSVVRSALGPICKLVFAAMEDTITRLQPRIAACAPDDEATMFAIGARLWPQAANILRDSVVPSDWVKTTGLQVSDFGPITRGLAAVLGQAVEIQNLAQQAISGRRVAEMALADLLSYAARLGNGSFGLMAVLLLVRVPQAAVVLRAIRRVAEQSDDVRLATVADFTLDYALASMQTAAERMIGGGTSLTAMAETLERLHAQLRDIDQSPYAQRADRRRRMATLRRHIEQACRERFSATLNGALLQPLLHGTIENSALETLARELRRLGEAGASFGDADAYDDMLRQAGETLVSAAPTATALAERVRMMEILRDSDLAIDLLQRMAPD